MRIIHLLCGASVVEQEIPIEALVAVLHLRHRTAHCFGKRLLWPPPLLLRQLTVACTVILALLLEVLPGAEVAVIIVVAY